MLSGKTILVTGGNGFFGRAVVNELVLKPCNIKTFRSAYFDLTNITDTYRLFEQSGKVDMVVHLAGWNGGIKYNLDYPGDIFSKNTAMAVNLFNACHKFQVKQVMSVLASCAWAQPKTDIFIKPEDILVGQPDPSVACHGYAKRNLYLMSKFAYEQYGIISNTACITTMYGPGDTFDTNRTKVMGALIKKFVDAIEYGHNHVECWGNGSPLRQFIYVEDAAHHLVRQLNQSEYLPTPVFIGGENNIYSIKEIAETIAATLGFPGLILWDDTKPNGQHAKCMENYIPNQKWVDIKTGILKTAEYYRANRHLYK